MKQLCLLLCLLYLSCGEFITFNYGGRANRLYVPQGYNKDKQHPLFVMLHGCTQNPDDFAAGTQMNKVADKHGFLVLYPLQPSSANNNKCWNWFETAHQARGSGEPAFIAGATEAVGKSYTIDKSKVFVAGLSAGGAMTSIMGATYPDIYSAVGVHAGLQYKAATSMVTAFDAMRNGGPNPKTQGAAAWRVMQAHAKGPLRTLVVQGKSDYTVYPINGNYSLIQWMSADSLALGSPETISLTPTSVRKDIVPGQGGRTYTDEEYTIRETKDVIGRFIIIEGMGHAWSGGSTAGTYTDPKGPDASTIMAEYFINSGPPTPPTPSPNPPTPSPPTPTPPTPPSTPSPTPPPTPSPSTPSLVIGSIPEETGYVGQLIADSYAAQDCRAGDKGSFMVNTYYTILSFDTGLIPRGATIASATLTLSVKSMRGSVGTVSLDMKSGNFGTSSALKQSDYNAAADLYNVITNWDPANSVDLPASALNLLNRNGRTRFRIKATTTASFSANTYFFDCDYGSTSPPSLSVTYTL